MEWVLIVAWIGNSFGIHTEDFNSVEACISARDWVRKEQPNTRALLRADCMPKGQRTPAQKDSK